MWYFELCLLHIKTYNSSMPYKYDISQKITAVLHLQIKLFLVFFKTLLTLLSQLYYSNFVHIYTIILYTYIKHTHTRIFFLLNIVLLYKMIEEDYREFVIYGEGVLYQQNSVTCFCTYSNSKVLWNVYSDKCMLIFYICCRFDKMSFNRTQTHIHSIQPIDPSLLSSLFRSCCFSFSYHRLPLEPDIWLDLQCFTDLGYIFSCHCINRVNNRLINSSCHVTWVAHIYDWIGYPLQCSLM